MTSIKDAVYDAFMLSGVGYKEMTLDDIALEIQDKNSDFKDFNLDTLRKQVSVYLANATSKIQKGQRVENKDSLYMHVKNGKGGYKKGVYKLRKPKPIKVQPIPDPIIIPNPNVSEENTLYIGSAGEMAVCSELLFRGYNVSRMSVDDGIDIIAMKNGRTYYLQVKTVQVKNVNFAVKISEKSFGKYDSNDCYYIIVAHILTDKNTPINHFLIFTADNIKQLLNSGDIKSNNGIINICFSQNAGHIFIKSFKVDHMLNSFDRIK